MDPHASTVDLDRCFFRGEKEKRRLRETKDCVTNCHDDLQSLHHVQSTHKFKRTPR